MKPLEQVDWTFMKRNLHEVGFQDFFDKYNLLVERVNELSVARSSEVERLTVNQDVDSSILSEPAK